MNQIKTTQIGNIPQAKGEVLTNLKSFGRELAELAKKYGIRMMIAVEVDIKVQSPFKHPMCKGGLRVVASRGRVDISSDGGVNIKFEETDEPRT